MSKLSYFIVAYFLSSSLICFVSCATEEELAAWNQFKSTFNKNYTADEEQERIKIFLDNKQYIESHNLKESSESGFKQGLNPLSDLTTEEIIRSRCGFRLNGTFAEENSAENNAVLDQLLSVIGATHNRAWYDNLARPSLDYRELGRVSRVKDQGSCGSCWAFATTGAIESILASRDQGVLLSEQNLVDCAGGRYGNHGCSGGLMDAALRYVRDHGIMASKDYPYRAENGACRARRDKITARVRGAMVLPRGNEALLRFVLALTGPLPVAIDASARSFHSYKSGVYDDRSCKSNGRNLNHAVLLVGYGVDRSGRDYWILKNSWGKSWGDNGYIKMARNKGNLCGVSSYAVLPIP